MARWWQGQDNVSAISRQLIPSLIRNLAINRCVSIVGPFGPLGLAISRTLYTVTCTD